MGKDIIDEYQLKISIENLREKINDIEEFFNSNIKEEIKSITEKYEDEKGNPAFDDDKIEEIGKDSAKLLSIYSKIIEIENKDWDWTDNPMYEILMNFKNIVRMLIRKNNDRIKLMNDYIEEIYSAVKKEKEELEKSKLSDETLKEYFKKVDEICKKYTKIKERTTGVISLWAKRKMVPEDIIEIKRYANKVGGTVFGVKEEEEAEFPEEI